MSSLPHSSKKLGFTSSKKLFFKDQFHYKDFLLHRRMLREAKPYIDNRLPETVMSSDKLQSMQRKIHSLFQIRYNNTMLLNNISSILRNDSKYHFEEEHKMDISNINRRLVQATEIRMENARILQHLISTRPWYNRFTFEEQFFASRRAVENVSKYPRTNYIQTHRRIIKKLLKIKFEQNHEKLRKVQSHRSKNRATVTGSMIEKPGNLTEEEHEKIVAKRRRVMEKMKRSLGTNMRRSQVVNREDFSDLSFDDDKESLRPEDEEKDAPEGKRLHIANSILNMKKLDKIIGSKFNMGKEIKMIDKVLDRFGEEGVWWTKKKDIEDVFEEKLGLPPLSISELFFKPAIKEATKTVTFSPRAQPWDDIIFKDLELGDDGDFEIESSIVGRQKMTVLKTMLVKAIRECSCCPKKSGNRRKGRIVVRTKGK